MISSFNLDILARGPVLRYIIHDVILGTNACTVQPCEVTKTPFYFERDDRQFRQQRALIYCVFMNVMPGECWQYMCSSYSRRSSSMISERRWLFGSPYYSTTLRQQYNSQCSMLLAFYASLDSACEHDVLTPLLFALAIL